MRSRPRRRTAMVNRGDTGRGGYGRVGKIGRGGAYGRVGAQGGDGNRGAQGGSGDVRGEERPSTQLADDRRALHAGAQSSGQQRDKRSPLRRAAPTGRQHSTGATSTVSTRSRPSVATSAMSRRNETRRQAQEKARGPGSSGATGSDARTWSDFGRGSERMAKQEAKDAQRGTSSCSDGNLGIERSGHGRVSSPGATAKSASRPHQSSRSDSASTKEEPSVTHGMPSVEAVAPQQLTPTAVKACPPKAGVPPIPSGHGRVDHSASAAVTRSSAADQAPQVLPPRTRTLFLRPVLLLIRTLPAVVLLTIMP